MHGLKQLLNSIIFIGFLILVFFSVYKLDYVSEMSGLSSNVILVIDFVIIGYIGYRYLMLSLQTGKLENEFTAIMNHTFRTPLTRVMWISKELEKDMPTKERLVYLGNITNATERVLDIIDLLAGIKNVRDRSGYVFEAVSLREIIEKSISRYKDDIQSKNINLQIPTFTGTPLLSVDLKKISFVIDTLIENAVHYTNQGGSISVECAVQKSGLVIKVSDTGMGLTFVDKIRMFSRFYRNTRTRTLNTDGMGIRLYLSKQIIERHHGRIYAQSGGKNKGSTFYIELPFNK